MSNPEGERSGDEQGYGLQSLTEAVDKVVAALRASRERASEAEGMAERSDELLRQFVDGKQDPGALARRVADLEAENEELRGRIVEGRQGVDRILASIRFLEDRNE